MKGDALWAWNKIPKNISLAQNDCLNLIGMSGHGHPCEIHGQSDKK